MADNPAASTATHPTPAAAPAAKSNRIPILLGLLAVMLAWYAYDHFIAKPQTVTANDAIQKLADERNKQGITTAEGAKNGEGRVTSADIQKVVGRAPYSVKTDKEYTIETYWWYSMPHRNYVSVLYVGKEPRRYNTHYINLMPPTEDLPTAIVPPQASTDKAGEGDEPAAAEAPPGTDSGAAAETETPAEGTEKPAADTEKPAAEKSPE